MYKLKPQNSGWGRFTNVEFVRCGQEGFTEAYDPRFAVSYVNTGPVVPARPSFIEACSFHHTYSSGIGVFGASGVVVKDNVVHRPIHDGWYCMQPYATKTLFF